MRTFNDWFMSLPPAEQAILREDRWMLAERAYNAALTTEQVPVAKLPCNEGLNCLLDELEAMAVLNDLPIAEGLGYVGTGLPMRVLLGWIDEKRKLIEKAV